MDDRVDLAADDRDRVLDEGRLVVVERVPVVRPDRGDNCVVDADSAGDVDVLVPLVAVRRRASGREDHQLPLAVREPAVGPQRTEERAQPREHFGLLPIDW